MFQGLKSHKLEFADELVRSNEKRAPFRAFNLSHIPSMGTGLEPG